MTLIFTSEHDDLRNTVRKFLAEYSSSNRVRETMETADGIDKDTWSRLAGELGLVGLAIPEEFGGSGAGPIEQLVVVEELGRAVASMPYLGTVTLVADTLVAIGGDVCGDVLSGIAAGDVTAALATMEDAGSPDRGVCTTVATPAAGGHALDGHKNFVLDGAAADVFLVNAMTPEGMSVFLVDAGAEGLVRTSLETLDRTRKQVRLEFSGVAGRLVGDPGRGREILDRTLDVGLAMIAAEQVGVAQACLDMTVEYAGMRKQFGRAIGSFQAVKHRLADMLVAVESARAAAHEAVRVAVEAPDELPVAAAMAKAVASDAAVFCATETIQLHGGIGFTWEHDAHLYYRRAHSTALQFGDAEYQRNRLGELLGL